jgi:hypothetical protein
LARVTKDQECGARDNDLFGSEPEFDDADVDATVREAEQRIFQKGLKIAHTWFRCTSCITISAAFTRAFGLPRRSRLA